jgi:hypothetical protein
VSRSSKAVKGKRKVETKNVRIKKRAIPERIRSERSRDNTGPQAGEAVALAAVALATDAAPDVNDQPGRFDPPQPPDTVGRATVIYSEGAATALAALQTWFLMPLRSLQGWQEAWFRLLPR